MNQPLTWSDLIAINDYTYEIPASTRPGMRVPARVFANQAMMTDILNDRSLEQLANVATLPGIQGYAFAMPDIHQGYGFPIGGVMASTLAGGVVSPGGIGYDINCGVRLLASNLTHQQIRKQVDTLATALYSAIPSGVGQGGALKLSSAQLDEVLTNGINYFINQGLGTSQDRELCENNGMLINADPSAVSDRAKQRGYDQLGTLGSGNHFLEVQRVDELLDPEAARALGLFHDQIVLMIHCGSRGLGHQVCTDYVRLMVERLPSWGISLPDIELACAPLSSPEAQQYLRAMAAAANFAWANRHYIMVNVRTAWQQLFDGEPLRLVYDVAHNIGKQEVHTINGTPTPVLVHRKGATRAFPPHHPDIPHQYQEIGQPVLIPGTMGTSSYVLVGTEHGYQTTFGSCCHGAGRRLSRHKAKTSVRGKDLRASLEDKGIAIRCSSLAGLAEEAPIAYKDVDNVVQVIKQADIARPVARLKPVAVIKGD